jgi:esterase/lipase
MQLKKDKEFERMKAVSDSMMAYQIELTRINVEAVEAIGSMRIELQRKAYDLIHEKTERYNELQNRALQQAQDQLERIEGNPNMSEVSRNIMINAVDKKLSGIIDNATRFIVQLNDDMQIISKDINLITTSGQDFIQRHLEQFQLIGMSGETTAFLENSSEKLVGFEK